MGKSKRNLMFSSFLLCTDLSNRLLFEFAALKESSMAKKQYIQ